MFEILASVLEQEVPVNGDFRAPLRAPAEAEHAFAGFLAACLGLATMDVPHLERDPSGRVDDDLIFLNSASPGPHCFKRSPGSRVQHFYFDFAALPYRLYIHHTIKDARFLYTTGE